MLKDMKDSLKAKLYDFTYTPFMSSVIISSIIINHKYLLILLSNCELEKKLKILDNYDFSIHIYIFTTFIIPASGNFFISILFGLFYVFVYPIFSRVFYSYTLGQTKKLKEIKKDIEDKTPLTREEEREIRQELDRLSIERDEMQTRLTKTEQYYEEKYQKKFTR